MNWHSLIFGGERPPCLEHDSVHIWRIATDGHNDLETFVKVLSSEERAIAEKFHFERERRSFIVSRGTLRHLLASYTGENAAGIRLGFGLQGKPFLANARLSELRFNISHSHEIALLAFALKHEIGVDVEFKRPDVDFIALADMSFSKDERAAITACSPAGRADLFYEYWTCKEACIKADGRGFSLPLDQFSVTAYGSDPRWREIVSVSSASLKCGLRSRILEVGNDYAAAVVANRSSWRALQLTMEFVQ
jgi:4'-phosphopantetheinyl transferase